MTPQYNYYVEPLALTIPTVEPTESILSTIAPTITQSIPATNCWDAVVTISVSTSLLTTIFVLGASAYCNYLRSYFRHKYLNSIASDTDSSDSSREDSVRTYSSFKSDLNLDESSRFDRFIWANFTFDQIYGSSEENIV